MILLEAGERDMGLLKRLKNLSAETTKAENPKNYRKIGLATNPSNYGWYKCTHCGRKFRKDSIDIDHIIPKSKGGQNNPENLQCLCIHCNRSKGNKTEQTKADLKARKHTYNEYKRSVILRPRLQEARKNLSKLKRELSDDDLLFMMDLYQKRDLEVYNDVKKEAKRRGLINV